MDYGYLKDLEKCNLCEHLCGVNRLKGEKGICQMTLPEVASCTLHPAPPKSYTVFMAGCNYKCLNCQNWTISRSPFNLERLRGFIPPRELAKECIERLYSIEGRLMRADRIFFSGGEPTIHLPYIEEVVRRARELSAGVKVNFDTNGYLTEESLERVLDFTTSITYDIKAFRDELHKALTGASSSAVLRNAEYIGLHAREKLWEFRVLVIPRVTDGEVIAICEFIASLDPSLPVCFLAFRPNHALEYHEGADEGLMNRCLWFAEEAGLTQASWAGYTGIPASRPKVTEDQMIDVYCSVEAQLVGTYARAAGCVTHPRDCKICPVSRKCRIKTYIPRVST